MTISSWIRAILPYLSATGRARMRRLRRAETEAILAADRMRRASQLAAIGAFHLGLADLSRQQAVAAHPGLAASAQGVVESLALAIRNEIDWFTQRG